MTHNAYTPGVPFPDGSAAVLPPEVQREMLVDIYLMALDDSDAVTADRVRELAKKDALLDAQLAEIDRSRTEAPDQAVRESAPLPTSRLQLTREQQRERLVDLYIWYFDSADFDGMGKVLALAVNDPELDQMIAGVNEVLYEEYEAAIAADSDHQG